MTQRITRASAAAMLAAVIPASVPAVAQSVSPAVFVSNNVSDQVSSFVVNPDGSVTFVANAPASDGPTAIAMSPDGRHLLVTHATQSTTTEVVHLYEVLPDATLLLVDSILVPDSPLGATWASDTVAVVTDTGFGGDNFIRSYRLDERTQTLSLADTAYTGSFNTAVIADRAHARLYAQDSTGFTVRQFEVDGDGLLTALDTVNTGGVYPLDPVLSADGSRLYAGGGISNGGNRIVGLNVDPDEGFFLMPGSPFVSPGASPAYCALARDDAVLLVGHGTDATVRSFLVGADGGLTSTGFSFDVGLQGTIGDLQTLGDVLFITDESTAIDGIAGLYSFHVGADGALTPIGPIATTGGVRPEAMAVWPGAPTTGDLDGDGDVDPADLAILLASWGACAECPADLDDDGFVGAGDLAILLAAWTT